MDKMETAVLLSGGLDSSVALHWAHRNHRVRVALSFDYASNHAERELKCAAWQAASLGIEHRVIDISSISSHLKSALLSGADDIPDGSYDEELMKQTVVPFRNGIFLSIAAGVAESCGAQQLVIAAHSGDHSIYPDCREEFMAAMTEAIRLGTYAGLGILRPFIHMSKGGIAAMGQDLGVDFSRTYSCQLPAAVNAIHLPHGAVLLINPDAHPGILPHPGIRIRYLDNPAIPPLDGARRIIPDNFCLGPVQVAHGKIFVRYVRPRNGHRILGNRQNTGFPVLPGKDLLAAVLEFQIEPVPDIIELVLEGYQIAAQTHGKGNFDAAFAYLSLNVLVFLKSCPLAHPFQQLPGIRRSLLGQGGGKGKKHGGHSRKKSGK